MEWDQSEEVRALFQTNGEQQEKLGRPLVLADAAHSFGATYKGRLTGSLADLSVFSFHAVKSLLVRPWLLFHPEVLVKYKFIWKNIKRKFGLIPTNHDLEENKHYIEQPSLGLLVIGVLPSSQGLVFGSKLLKEFELKAKNLGIQILELSVKQTNTKAIRSYLKNGWTEVNKDQRALSMKKFLQMKIPFCLPLIDQDVIDEMMDTLINTGWLTSGPKSLQLEKEIVKLTGAPAAICVNSWTSGAMLMLRWYDIGPGDEVIIPAYTYSATALCIMNIGATPVMVDVADDFDIAIQNIEAAITPRTKAIIPVDIGGWPCDYQAIFEVISTPRVQAKFQPATDNQRKLNRILILADAAHSIGATCDGKQSGTFADTTVFSFHSVKNVTTGEGGAVCLKLPSPFDNEEEYKFLKFLSLNGQTKSAFQKNQVGGWRYDIVAQGLKVNMPDVCAAIGLSQIKRYKAILLPERKTIFEYYNNAFRQLNWAILPPNDNAIKTSSYHLYLLRIKDISETERDQMIQSISERGVGVNVHYIPMAMLTLFKTKGYDIKNYPNTYNLFKGEISLPIYNGLNTQQLDYVIESVKDAYSILNKVLVKKAN